MWRKKYLRPASFLLKMFCFQKFQRSTEQIAEACNKMHSWDNYEEREGARSHSCSSKMRPWFYVYVVLIFLISWNNVYARVRGANLSNFLNNVYVYVVLIFLISWNNVYVYVVLIFLISWNKVYVYVVLTSLISWNNVYVILHFPRF